LVTQGEHDEHEARWLTGYGTPSPHASLKNDDGYFEEMSKVVFRAGLNWSVIEKKWPDIRRALANFSIDDVAQFDDRDIDRLLKDEGMIRSAKKITGVIASAQASRCSKHLAHFHSTWTQSRQKVRKRS
jgi:3-methyladenine DNA glycosylase Tag